MLLQKLLENLFLPMMMIHWDSTLHREGRSKGLQTQSQTHREDRKRIRLTRKESLPAGEGTPVTRGQQARLMRIPGTY